MRTRISSVKSVSKQTIFNKKYSKNRKRRPKNYIKSKAKAIQTFDG